MWPEGPTPIAVCGLLLVVTSLFAEQGSRCMGSVAMLTGLVALSLVESSRSMTEPGSPALAGQHVGS